MKPPEPIIAEGHCRNGVLEWRTAWQFIKAAVKRWPDTPVTLTLAVKEETRRAKQSRYYFGVVVREIARETGHTKDQIHELLKHMFLAQTIELVNPLTGEVTEQQIVKSTTKLTVDEFCDYVTQCQMWAAEFLGLVIPEAEPRPQAKKGKAA